MKKIVFIFLLLIIPSLILGQLKIQDKPVQIKRELTQPPGDQFLGLSIFDPSKFSMSHSVSMSYFSMGDDGFSRSVYLNTLKYQIASPLMLSVQWGVQNFPTNSFAKDHPAFQNGFFLSGAELKYQPSDKFEMRIQYNRMPGMYNRYRYYDPFRFYSRSMWDDER